MSEQRNSFLRSAFIFVERDKKSFSRSTYLNYRTALRAFARFGGQEYGINDISVALMTAFQRWLAEHNVGRNTSSCYMRSLRSLYRKLGGEKEPFRDVYTGMERTEKRALTLEEIRRLRNLQLKYKSKMDITRDLFLFSFYSLGMPFVDLAFLRRANIRGDFIVYRRHKTGQKIKVPLETCMVEIIEKYTETGNRYLFPIITEQNPDKQLEQYKVKLGNYNRMLKKLAVQAGISRNLSSYVVRHSWASAAYEGNVDLPVISKALGHTNARTTQIYISEINDERLSEASHKLLSDFLSR